MSEPDGETEHGDAVYLYRGKDTVLRHDPDEGCVDCLAVRCVPGPTVGAPLYFCGAEWQVRHAESVQQGDPCFPARRVSRHPAPDWCPLRRGRVVVESVPAIPMPNSQLFGPGEDQS